MLLVVLEGVWLNPEHVAYVRAAEASRKSRWMPRTPRGAKSVVELVSGTRLFFKASPEVAAAALRQMPALP